MNDLESGAITMTLPMLMSCTIKVKRVAGELNTYIQHGAGTIC